MSTAQTKILAAIRRRGAGKVFISKDFIALATREAVDQALSRLARAQQIKRLGRGLYYSPRINKNLGIELTPATDEIVNALARRTRSRIVPSGAVAANQLGLSTQVPAKPVYLTDGRSRQIRIGNTTFTIKHASTKELPPGNPLSAMVFQAIRHLGKNAIDEEIIARLRRRLSSQEQRKLLEDARYATEWVANVIRRAVTEEAQETTARG